MPRKTDILRSLIREAIISEMGLEDVSSVKCVAGSTHTMKTCKIGKDSYYLKFSEPDLFDETDPSLQVLVEYLAYRIYRLYQGVKVPHAELVYDDKSGQVGLATSAVKGKPGLTTLPAARLGRMMSAGLYVDIFLANWDVVGTDSGNVIVVGNDVARIDPGGALTFRAQGGRKGAAFGPKAKELKTMLDPNSGGAGRVLTHADMRHAAETFLSVSWGDVMAEIRDVDAAVTEELTERQMSSLLKQWKRDASHIAKTLKPRHADVVKHAKTML